MSFTLADYREMLKALKAGYGVASTFSEFMSSEMKASVCLIRHDVDRKKQNALEMARIEAEEGLSSTFYFRARTCSWDEGLAKEIHALGHEVGFHYESLSDSKGDFEKAHILFEKELSEFRRVVPILTFSMHGRPLSRIDNRDMWREIEFRKKRCAELGLIGEVYLDIDYKNIAYISDTGRSWAENGANLRDEVVSDVRAYFNSQSDLNTALEQKVYDQIVLQVHPERWAVSKLDWLSQFALDAGVNTAKRALKAFR